MFPSSTRQKGCAPFHQHIPQFPYAKNETKQNLFKNHYLNVYKVSPHHFYYLKKSHWVCVLVIFLGVFCFSFWYISFFVCLLGRTKKNKKGTWNQKTVLAILLRQPCCSYLWHRGNCDQVHLLTWIQCCRITEDKCIECALWALNCFTNTR